MARASVGVTDAEVAEHDIVVIIRVPFLSTFSRKPRAGGGFGTRASKATSVLAGGSRSVRGRTRDSVRFLAAAACACRARVSW